MDFVCHGVPSQKLWTSFLRQAAKGRDPHRLDAAWHGKTRGWQDAYELTLSEDRQIFCRGYASENEPFLRHFLRCTAQNLPCYACAFVGTHSGADIRVCDFWGERYKADAAGVSRVEVLTARGLEVWSEAAARCVIEPLAPAESAASEVRKPTADPPAWGRAVFIRLLDWPAGFALAHGWSLIGCAWARLRRIVRR